MYYQNLTQIIVKEVFYEAEEARLSSISNRSRKIQIRLRLAKLASRCDNAKI